MIQKHYINIYIKTFNFTIAWSVIFASFCVFDWISDYNLNFFFPRRNVCDIVHESISLSDWMESTQCYMTMNILFIWAIIHMTNLYVAVTFRHSCLPVFVWRTVVVCFFDPKQLLRVSCILWCYLTKWYSTILYIYIHIQLYYF